MNQVHSQQANPNPTNSEMDSKQIIKSSDKKFYAQRDANFKDRIYRILFDDVSGHSDEEVIELITRLRTEDSRITNLMNNIDSPLPIKTSVEIEVN